MNISLIISVICLAICIVSFLFSKWYIKQRTSPSGVLNETKDEVKKWINIVNESIDDINEVTENNLMLIEDKIIKLNELLDDTDRRISVYIKEIEKSRTSEALYTQLGRGVRAAVKNEKTPQIPVTQVNSDLPPAAQSPALLPTQPQASPPPEKPKKDSDSKPPTKKQIREEIEKLANERHTAREIASLLHISVAEVELVLQLRRK